MKVIATRTGYYEHKRRKPGAKFVLKSESHFSNKWMCKPEDYNPEKEEEYEGESDQWEPTSYAELASGTTKKRGRPKKIVDETASEEVA